MKLQLLVVASILLILKLFLIPLNFKQKTFYTPFDKVTVQVYKANFYNRSSYFLIIDKDGQISNVYINFNGTMEKNDMFAYCFKIRTTTFLVAREPMI